MNIMQLRASDEQVLQRKSPTLPDYTCPIDAGYVVRKGWFSWFDTVVEVVGGKVLVDVDTGWLVPVMFTNGKFGILFYRFYNRQTDSADHVLEIKSSEHTCNWNIRNSLLMPQIVAVRDGSVIVHVSQEVEADDVSYAYHGQDYDVKAWEIRLHNVFGLVDRKDEIVPLIPTGID